LQPGTFFDKNENLFVWRYQENDLYMDIGEQIRFRVLSLNFVEEAPMRKEVLMAARRAAAALPGAPVVTSPYLDDESAGRPESVPFKIVGSIAEDGLGLLSWWGAA
jgi:DNA-directed RNA polymerase III subunit RPC8